MKNYTAEDLIYFAGFFDGEGHIGLYITSYSDLGYETYGMDFQLGNTDIGIINWIKEKFGGVVREGNKKGTKCGGSDKYYSNKDSFMWQLGIEEVKVILPDLIPYLKVKKKQGILLLEYITKKRRFGVSGRPSWYRQWAKNMHDNIKNSKMDNYNEDILIKKNEESESLFRFVKER